MGPIFCARGAAVEKRLREELADLQVEINEEKSRIVDLGRGGTFGFLGFDFRRIRSRRGAWRANYTPQLKSRTALQRKLKDVFRRHQSQPVDRVVQLINPILRGWVNYFAVGHSSECFSFIKDWVEKKVRATCCALGNERASVGRDGIGSGCTKPCDCSMVTGFADRCRKSPRQDRSHKPWVKQTGERSAGNLHAAFDEAGAGNVARSRWCDTRRRKGETTGNTNFDLNRRASPRPYR